MDLIAELALQIGIGLGLLFMDLRVDFPLIP